MSGLDGQGFSSEGVGGHGRVLIKGSDMRFWRGPSRSRGRRGVGCKGTSGGTSEAAKSCAVDGGLGGPWGDRWGERAGLGQVLQAETFTWSCSHCCSSRSPGRAERACWSRSCRRYTSFQGLRGPDPPSFP